MKQRYLPGVLLNLASLVVALVVLLPYAGGIVLMALGTLLAQEPGLFLLVVLVVAVILLGPVIGLALALVNRRSTASLVTAMLSLASAPAVAWAAASWDLEWVGVCKPLTDDVSHIGRECSQSKIDDCPAFYSCVQRVVNVNSSWECAIICQEDCQCPTGFRCSGSKCKPAR